MWYIGSQNPLIYLISTESATDLYVAETRAPLAVSPWGAAAEAEAAAHDDDVPPTATVTAVAAARKEEAALNWVIALLVGAIVALLCRKASVVATAATLSL